jgi:hypothetical protein
VWVVNRDIKDCRAISSSAPDRLANLGPRYRACRIIEFEFNAVTNSPVVKSVTSRRFLSRWAKPEAISVIYPGNSGIDRDDKSCTVSAVSGMSILVVGNEPDRLSALQTRLTSHVCGTVAAAGTIAEPSGWLSPEGFTLSSRI